MTRGQMNLPALAVALLVLTIVTGMSVSMADRAYLGAERDATSQQVATATSERLVSDESPLTRRPNVLSASELDTLNGSQLETLFPVTSGHDFRVTLGDTVIAERGDPTGGATIRRIVLVERRYEVTRTPRLSATDPRFTLPRRTSNVTLSVEPPNGTAVSVVRTNGHVVLQNESGLDGTFSVRVSRFETVQFAFETGGSLPTGSIRVTYYPPETRKTILAVTVDD